MERSNAMTIGQLSRRTGVPVKVLRPSETSSYPHRDIFPPPT